MTRQQTLRQRLALRHLPTPSEEMIQIAVAQFLDLALPNDAVWFHVPNGGQRHGAVAGKLKAQGVKPGVPDIFILYQGKVFFIELKSSAGVLSDAQSVMQIRLSAAGADVKAIARSVDEVFHYLAAQGFPLKVKRFGLGWQRVAA